MGRGTHIKRLCSTKEEFGLKKGHGRATLKLLTIGNTCLKTPQKNHSNGLATLLKEDRTYTENIQETL